MTPTIISGNLNLNNSTIQKSATITSSNITVSYETTLSFVQRISNKNDFEPNIAIINFNINNETVGGENVCQPHAPYEMLNEWQRLLFGSSIFITAIITFLLNLLVIVAIVLNKRRNRKPRKCSSSSISSAFLMQKQQLIAGNSQAINQNASYFRQNSCMSTNSISSTSLVKSCGSVSGLYSARRNSINLQRKKFDQQKHLGKILFKKSSETSHHCCCFSTTIQTNYSHTHQSFISLSISVIIYSSLCVPAMYLETIDRIPVKSDNFIIKLLRFSFYVSPIASSFIHLLMAFDRYLAIKQCFSLQQYWYRRHYTKCIVFLWIFSILIVIPFLWYKHYFRTMQIILTVVRLMLTFSIPSLLTLALYVSIAYELDRIRKETKMIKSLMQNNKLIVKNKNIIAKIIILASTHFLCWFPFSVVESISDLFPELFHKCDSHVQNYYFLMAILILITSMSGIAYPILYCFVSKEFRKMFRFKISLFKTNNDHFESFNMKTTPPLERQQHQPLPKIIDSELQLSSMIKQQNQLEPQNVADLSSSLENGINCDVHKNSNTIGINGNVIEIIPNDGDDSDDSDDFSSPRQPLNHSISLLSFSPSS